MIDRDAALAYKFAPVTFEVERGRLRAFARSIGETDPTYVDVEAARAAGHQDLPVPPTFFFSMLLEVEDPFEYLTALDVDIRFVLHGEQQFEYHHLAYAGETLVLNERISDVYVKRGGAMEFVVKQADVRRGETVLATMKCVVVVRHSEVAA